jgi:hypothetical protein
MNISTSKLDNLSFSGIDTKDYPDFSDAMIESGDYKGRELTDEEIDYINEEFPDFVHDKLFEYLF